MPQELDQSPPRKDRLLKYARRTAAAGGILFFAGVGDLALNTIPQDHAAVRTAESLAPVRKWISEDPVAAAAQTARNNAIYRSHAPSGLRIGADMIATAAGAVSLVGGVVLFSRSKRSFA